MKILHVSDLHYRESPEVWSLLKEAGRQFELLRPDLILITGDLTNDGLEEQFQRVKRFIASLNFCPVLVIPGNRDLTRASPPPPVERSDLEYFMLTHPEPKNLIDEMEALDGTSRKRLGKYLDYFPTTEFFYRDHNIAAVGLVSMPEITSRQIEQTVQHFARGAQGELRIFCAHHSFLPVPTKKLRAGDTVPHAADILQTLIESNVNLLCCGHIHRSHVWSLSDGRHNLLCCNAGSLLDTSGKKDNGFLEMEIGREIVIVKHSLFSRRIEPLYRAIHQTMDGKHGRREMLLSDDEQELASLDGDESIKTKKARNKK